VTGALYRDRRLNLGAADAVYGDQAGEIIERSD